MSFLRRKCHYYKLDIPLNVIEDTVFTPLKMSNVRCHEEVTLSDMPGHLCRKTTSTSTSSLSSCRKSFRKWETDS